MAEPSYLISDLPSSLAARIRVDTVTGCWLYGKPDRRNLYAQLRWEGRCEYAHRVVYALLAGPIPEGLTLDHVEARGCIYKRCCWPAHLEPVTNAENIRRYWATHERGQQRAVKPQKPVFPVTPGGDAGPYQPPTILALAEIMLPPFDAVTRRAARA